MTAPAYICDGAVVRENITKLRKTLPQFSILYSIKANPHAPLLSYIASQNIGADAASKNEVLLSRAAGIVPEDIYYSGPGKTYTDLEETFDSCILIADSFHELELINRIAAEKHLRKRVGVRINPSFGMDSGSGTASKSGIDEKLCTKDAFAVYSSLTITVSSDSVSTETEVVDNRRKPLQRIRHSGKRYLTAACQNRGPDHRHACRKLRLYTLPGFVWKPEKTRREICHSGFLLPLRLLGQPAHKYRNMQGKAIFQDPDHCIHNIPTEE